MTSKPVCVAMTYTLGLRNVDPNGSTVAQLSDTRVIGMAPGMAALTRGQQVGEDAL